MHPGKLTTPRTFIERACAIMTAAYYISNNGGPDVFVNYCPHVRGIAVYTYEPKWVKGAVINHMFDASEMRPSELDAIESHLNAILGNLQ